ncbi:hypothetical protein [Thermomonospora cellulosilytica]|uniref:Uncharacterized protein n=1 Tax=Thermomonospora cellulosilytica TaxID=1411118 RepID=A0A7W3R6M8_9ACTN|nr:hypothetical protein [Thermomonospora cellulosilytica]MBA9002353.1 hypothetical protein [Thermomonospora cellulosilytica]
MADEGLFEQVAEVVRGSVPRELGRVRIYAHRVGVKVWFGAERPSRREHYEAQLISADILHEAREHALEIGFHTEHSKEAANEAVLAALLAHENRWRPGLGDEPVAGPFLGRTTWRRISETWLDPDLTGPDVPFEIGVRLAEYITALEPHVRPLTTTRHEP